MSLQISIEIKLCQNPWNGLQFKRYDVTKMPLSRKERSSNLNIYPRKMGLTLTLSSMGYLRTLQYGGRGHYPPPPPSPNFVVSSSITIKGPVKLIKQVKIAHSFSQSVSNQFHVIILSLPL